MKNVRVVIVLVMLCSPVCLCAAAQNGFKQLAVLQPSNSTSFDYFGRWTSMSGNVLAAGCSPAVCVFVKPASGWTNMEQTALLTASDGAVLEDAAVDGNTVVGVGSNGAAYLFLMPSTGWANMIETAKLTASDGNLFYSVAINGRIVVAGAQSATVGSNQAQGAAYVFAEPAAGWSNMTQNAELTASDGAAGDRMGSAVAISGRTIVTGAPYATTNSSGEQYGQGAAYVFTEPSGGWTDATQNAKLTASNATSIASLGNSVAIEGQTLVAGAPYQYDGNGFYGGEAYVFIQPASGWTNTTETAQLIPTNALTDISMGWSVSISGKLIAVGAPGSGFYIPRQAAYEFIEPAGGWKTMNQTAVEGTNTYLQYSEFGYSVSNSGTIVIVGAPGFVYQNYIGSIYLYGQ